MRREEIDASGEGGGVASTFFFGGGVIGPVDNRIKLTFAVLNVRTNVQILHISLYV